MVDLFTVCSLHTVPIYGVSRTFSLCKRKQWNGELSRKTHIRPAESPSCLSHQVFCYGGFEWRPLSPANSSPSAQGQSRPAESLVSLQWHVRVGDHLYNSGRRSAHCLASCTTIGNRFDYLRCVVEFIVLIGSHAFLGCLYYIYCKCTAESASFATLLYVYWTLTIHWVTFNLT